MCMYMDSANSQPNSLLTKCYSFAKQENEFSKEYNNGVL